MVVENGIVLYSGDGGGRTCVWTVLHRHRTILFRNGIHITVIFNGVDEVTNDRFDHTTNPGIVRTGW